MTDGRGTGRVGKNLKGNGFEGERREQRRGAGKGRGGVVWGLGLGVGKRQKHSGHSGEEEEGRPETNGSWSGTSLGLSGTTYRREG